MDEGQAIFPSLGVVKIVATLGAKAPRATTILTTPRDGKIACPPPLRGITYNYPVLWKI